MKITIRSTAFEPGKQIPKKYTGEGEDLSPPLTWSGALRKQRNLRSSAMIPMHRGRNRGFTG